MIIDRILHMRWPELVYRGRQETFKFVDRIRTIGVAPDPGANRAGARFKRFVQNAREHFFEGVFDRNVPRALTAAGADESQLMLVAADRVFHGRFNLLGYRDLDFGDPIDWQLDAVSGTRAPFVHWSRIDPLDVTSVGDSKVTWELNRHQWVVHLAQAWRLTGYERYAEAVVQQMKDWMRANPTGMGINWASSLEVALRLISWCWSVLLIADSRVVTEGFFERLEKCVEAHARHIERYLSVYFSPNTHLTGEALGLLYASVVFPHLPRAHRWRSLAVRILTQEIERQVVPDGVYFERSTCYQRYTTDIYLHFLTLAARNGIEVPPIVGERTRAMLDVLIALRNPDGSMPSIGDEDGGMLLPLSWREPYDYRSTFSTAAVVFNEPVYAWAATTIAPETLWMFGVRGAEAFKALDPIPPRFEPSRGFESGGFAVMRSGWEPDAHSLIFDAGPLGCNFSSGHGHADLLSIQCSVSGQPFLVDAGTCCYTADRQLRDFFRGTAAHSTVMIDGKSQAEPAGPFAWQSRCGARLTSWHSDESLVDAIGEHNAYSSITHRRRVSFIQARYWIVVDDLIGSENHRVDVRFQFAPMDVHIDNGWVRARRDGRSGLLVKAFSATPLEATVREGCRQPLEGWISPDYGQIKPAPAVVFSATATLPLRVTTLLYPANDFDTQVPPDALREVQARAAERMAG